MLYELPLAALKQRFHGLCDLRANTNYPIETGSSIDSVSGHARRVADSVHFSLHERRGLDEIAYAGSFTFKSVRGKIPTNLAINGWTIFRGAIEPAAGERSNYATLGDLARSVAHQP